MYHRGKESGQNLEKDWQGPANFRRPELFGGPARNHCYAAGRAEKSFRLMAFLPEKSEKVVQQVLTLAEENGLVCFDPRAGRVYLPPHLAAKQGGDTLRGPAGE
jgi:hypothetical protein